MSSALTKSKHDILMKYKSKNEKRKAINKFIDIIIAGKIPSDEIEEMKEESVILAESLLRNRKSST